MKTYEDYIYLLRIAKITTNDTPTKRPRKIGWFVALLLCLSVSTFAQDAYISVNYVGYSNGQYAYQVVSKQPASCNPDISISWVDANVTAVSPNGKNDLHSNKVTGASTILYFTGAYNKNARFTFTDLSICTWEGSAPTPVTVAAVSTSLPIVLNYFQYKDGAFTWQTAQESNTASFQVQLQQDGQTDWSIIGSQPAVGNSSTATNYSLAWSGYTATASFGLILLLLGGVRKRRQTLIAIAFCVAVVSCTKSISKPSYQIKGSYRLVEIDKDGVKTYSKIIHY